MQIAGTVVDGKYELVKEIGTGGFATVYRARQLGFDREVALKLLHPHDVDESILKRFEREAKILQGFQTKFIPAIYGYGVWENRPYMALELVSGVSLAEVMNRGERMSLERLKPIISAVAEGLAYAHAHNVVHRDLSPSNIILVNQQGMPDARIIDFGLAAFTELDLRNRQKLTEAGYAVGSFQYMSPEQCMAEPADERSDIYALGCIIYHALMGSVPFPIDNPVLLLAKHVHEPIPRIGVEFSVTLQAVLDRATAKNRADRYQSAGEFLKDWKSVDSGTSSVRRPNWLPSPTLGLISVSMILFTAVAIATVYRGTQPVPVVAESPIPLVDKAVELYEMRKEFIGDDSGLKKLLDEHYGYLQRALAIQNATHQMSPMQVEVLYIQLSWNLRRRDQIAQALEFSRQAILADIARHVPCNSPLSGYQDAMEVATPDDQREFIRVMEKILAEQPPYNSTLKQAAYVGIADARARLGDIKGAWEILPPGKEIHNDNEKNYQKVLRFLRSKAVP